MNKRQIKELAIAYTLLAIGSAILIYGFMETVK